MRKVVYLLLFLFALPFGGCELSDENDEATITIVPMGNYRLSEIVIRRDEEKNKNYADPASITGRTSYDVPPGYYYVFLRYKNLETDVSGWWQTTNDTKFTVEAGDSWSIEYGYSGGTVKQK